MKTQLRSLSLLLVSSVLVVGNAAADSPLSEHDKEFVTKAAEGGMAEVELGKIAEKQGHSAAVKKFGKKMVVDHSKANSELQKLAKQKGIDLPSAPSEETKANCERMKKLSGSQFDTDYMKNMLDDHQKDVAEFQQEATAATDPDLKKFVDNTLPTLQQHLKHATTVESQLHASK